MLTCLPCASGVAAASSAAWLPLQLLLLLLLLQCRNAEIVKPNNKKLAVLCLHAGVCVCSVMPVKQ